MEADGTRTPWTNWGCKWKRSVQPIVRGFFYALNSSIDSTVRTISDRENFLFIKTSSPLEAIYFCTRVAKYQHRRIIEPRVGLCLSTREAIDRFDFPPGGVELSNGETLKARRVLTAE